MRTCSWAGSNLSAQEIASERVHQDAHDDHSDGSWVKDGITWSPADQVSTTDGGRTVYWFSPRAIPPGQTFKATALFADKKRGGDAGSSCGQSAQCSIILSASTDLGLHGGGPASRGFAGLEGKVRAACSSAFYLHTPSPPHKSHMPHLVVALANILLTLQSRRNPR